MITGKPLICWPAGTLSLGDGRRRRLWLWFGDSERCTGMCGAALPRRCDVVSRSLERIHNCRPEHRNFADIRVDGNVGCVRCVPSQLGRVARLDRIGTDGQRRRRRRRRNNMLMARAQYGDCRQSCYSQTESAMSFSTVQHRDVFGQPRVWLRKKSVGLLLYESIVRI